ncbi:MAG: ribonuclease H-like domain-containing protein [Gammaproteobacteria bacterium]
MDLKARLSALKGQRGAPAGAEPAIPGATISERVRRLTVQATHTKRACTDDHDVAARLQGQAFAPGLIRIEQRRLLAHVPGWERVSAAAFTRFSLLTGADALEPNELLFLDTETTGLAGGTGTLPFLLGLARIDGDELHLCQWFLTGFRGEATLLEDARSWYGRARHLVSFNGKAFDVPLLTTRYRLARLAEPLSVIKHLDLLHPTRRAFGSRWPDCRLQTAERELLAFEREDDLPGHLVPEAWAAFVRSGTFTEVPRILHHNLLDLITLTGLLSRLVRVYAEPGFADSDTRAIARGFRQRGHDAIAYQYLCDRSEELDAAGLMELADLHRQRRLWREAVQIWTRLAYEDHALAMERLAKYYEHVRRDPRAALLWSSRLLQVQAEDRQHHRRQARLLERLNASS